MKPATTARATRQGRWRPWLLGTAGAVGGVVVANWVLLALPAARVRFGATPGPALGIVLGSPTTHHLMTVAAAAAVLGCVVVADGRYAAGLGQPWSGQARVLGYYLVGPMFGIAVTTLVWSAVTAWWWNPTTTGADASGPALWPVLLAGLAAAVWEEVLVVAVAYRLLHAVPGPGGRPLATAGLGTALLVGLRLSYHLHHGPAVLVLLPWAWLTIRLYRHTRTLPPLIAGHALFYLTLPLAPGPQFAVLLALGAVLLAATHGTPSTSRPRPDQAEHPIPSYGEPRR